MSATIELSNMRLDVVRLFFTLTTRARLTRHHVLLRGSLEITTNLQGDISRYAWLQRQADIRKLESLLPG